MPKSEFILQGFTSRTHKDAIRRLFELKDIQRVLISVAFANLGGVQLLREHLKAHAPKVVGFVGIRNEITSSQAVKELLAYGISVHLVDTGSRTLVFHPKLYLVRAAKEARLLIGSANLTLGGLNNNIEGSVSMDLDLHDPADLALVDAVEKGFASLPAEYPLHVFKVTTAAKVDDLEANGRLLDEATASPPTGGATAKSATGDPIPKIPLKVPPIFATVPGKKPAPAAALPKTPVSAKAPAIVPSVASAPLELLWESAPLKRRDLNIPDGETTNKTGSINLDKGLLPDGIDFRHYFRDEVFSGLTWVTAKAPNVEESHAHFELFLKGVSYGAFDLRVGHSTSTTSKSYVQGNAMTRLSWGPIRDFIARPDLIGRTLSLRRNTVDPTRFVIEID